MEVIEAGSQAKTLIDRILFLLMQEDIDITGLKNKLVIIMSDYDITLKEKALTVYTKGKNEFFLEKFLLAKAVAGRQERTLKAYKDTISRALREIGKDADTVTAFDVQIYLANLLSKGCTKSFCDTVRRYLSSFFGYLTKEEIISKNPMNKVENIKYKTEKETAFSDMEIELMRAQCKTTMEKALFELLLSTGCRASEAVSIKYADIKDSEVKILGKGGKVRTVFINAKAAVAIRSYLDERRDSNPYLFPAMLPLTECVRHSKSEWFKDPKCIGEGHYSHESVNDHMKRLGKRAGVQNVHAHRFRRTCATQALRHGMPIEYVSMMLGHEQISTTQIYLDLRESDLKAAHEKYVI